jgi:hypothetical protein
MYPGPPASLIGRRIKLKDVYVAVGSANVGWNMETHPELSLKILGHGLQHLRDCEKTGSHMDQTSVVRKKDWLVHGPKCDIHVELKDGRKGRLTINTRVMEKLAAKLENK